MENSSANMSQPGVGSRSTEGRLLAVDALIRSFAYSAKSVVRDLNLVVQQGESVALLGPSGCGKSTLIRILAGLAPQGTRDVLDGKVSLFGCRPRAYRATGKLAAMFQEPTLLPHLSVEQNVGLPLEFLRRRDPDAVSAVIRLVGLDEFRTYLPRDLSGGMRTRTALARGFVSKPDLLLLDEPFTGLDLGWKESLYRSLQELRDRYGTTVVMVTHDLEEAIYNSDRTLVIGANGTPLEEIPIPGRFPREYLFGETASRHVNILKKLVELLGGSPAERMT